MNIEHSALLVDDYDEAIRFFVDALGFELVEDSPATTNDGRPKRWVVVRPPGAATGLLLAQADGDEQRAAVGAAVRRPGGPVPAGRRFRSGGRAAASSRRRVRRRAASRGVRQRRGVRRRRRQPLGPPRPAVGTHVTGLKDGEPREIFSYQLCDAQDIMARFGLQPVGTCGTPSAGRADRELGAA